ncbi:GH19226 [Drosophila grimshawi]|uniref:GH19226 n=2 Tax=Drosophila grimshawi TaxID=7222 RepID=B4JF20_DROGR|nr:GH19226 [Drosophila grimshawi]
MDLQLALFILALLAVCQADTLVQLHVNRPYNDVSEKFVSFAVRPEDLYDALDGKNRKAVTSMAALLEDAYVKFVGDFYFATNAPKRLRNPTKIIWKGFNRWTSAVNWTMIIPVPYAPDEWDSMHTLKILNSSYMVGITDCIWQLGTDFGTSRAKDYVQELTTLKLMTDTFSPYVDSWRVMGADISAGSSAEETRKYVDMSKDLNAAFGWTQPANMLPTSSLGSYIFDSDPALRTLRQQRVPLWLTLPEERSRSQSISKRLVGDETTDALRWAQTLGDAASGGFDVVFKRMTLEDFERPNFSYYVTALFKKVMGSRVFPARPLNVVLPSNKLYTHCANAMSGGLAFMVVNTEEQPLTITVRSTSRLSSSDIWQYVLTGEDGRVRLNNLKLSVNSTLRPLVKSKDATKSIQLITPSMSVGFWVLPSVDLEHCQYSEIEADETDASSEASSEKGRSSGYSSADRLLQRLIEETAVARGSLQSTINRNRRFVLDNPDTAEMPGSLLGRLLQPLSLAQEKPVAVSPIKRQVDAEPKSNSLSVHPCKAMAWLRNVMEQSREVSQRNGRSRRSASDSDGPFFYNRNGKKTTLTKKITEIRKPERKVKPLFDLAEFDEEEFFKKMGEQPEPPPYSRLPEGDVHLKHIETPDGEESEMQPEPEQIPKKKRRPSFRKQLKIVQRSQEESDEDLPEPSKEKLRLLPTEFIAALPAPTKKSGKRLNLGATLNSLLFPEPFSNKGTKAKNQATSKSQEQLEPDVEPIEGDGYKKRSAKIGNVANDFWQAQRELGKHFFSHINEHEHEFALGDENMRETSLETDTLKREGKAKPSAQTLHANDNEEDYFGAKTTTERAPAPVPAPKRLKMKIPNKGIPSWWDMPALRPRRALPFSYDDDSLNTNVIHKDDQQELLPLGRYSMYEYKVDLPTMTPPTTPKESTIMKISATKAPASTCKKVTLSDKIVTTVKSKVSKFMSIISRHMNEWYNTLTKHLDGDPGKPRNQSNEGANAIDK